MMYGKRLFTQFLIACVLVWLGIGAMFHPSTGLAQMSTVGSPQSHRTEIGVVPLFGGDTDVGVGVGLLSTVAGVAPKVEPYRWAVESAGFISFKRANGSFLIPYQDYSIQWTEPQFLQKRLRIEIRPSYTRETLQRFYGLGNASPEPAQENLQRDFFGRTHPTLWVRIRYKLWGHVYAGVGSSYTHNWLVIHPKSTLAEKMTNGTPIEKAILGTPGRHGVLLLEGIFLFDNRDSETVSKAGQFHQIRMRLSPAMAGATMPYSYQQLNLSSHFYYSLIPQRMVVAIRLVTDLQFGRPPFYELARYDDTFALGGQNGVRGVPGQRYYGKIKVFANFETRLRLTRFVLWTKPIVLGAALFFDAGRAFTEWKRHAQFDGSGWGLKYGTGGGLRLQQGKTFVVRADIAWSPDARPLGAYLGAGQMF
jgi:outer membrane protein assembly factor BamA